MSLQTCQIIDTTTRGTIYLEDHLGNVLVNKLTTYPVQLDIEIIDVINGTPVTYNSEHTITLSQAPTNTIRNSILPLIQAIQGLSGVTI
jgi:hypothetical protein